MKQRNEILRCKVNTTINTNMCKGKTESDYNLKQV